MIQKGQWQETAVRDLVTLLEPQEAVRALILKGSYANPAIQPDIWSDIDITLVVSDEKLSTFFPTLSWLEPLGDLYTFDQSTHAHGGTTRACFTDFRRIDCTFVEEAHFLDQPIHSTATRLLFSRSPVVDDNLAHITVGPPAAPQITSADFKHMSNQFWFKGMLITSKVMRNDLLIATHLALELIQDLCILAMMLRDRTYGTSHHRQGGMGNDFIAQLNQTRHLYTALGILETVKDCSIQFDSLAQQWVPGYQERRYPLLAWIAHAQEMLSGPDI
ncbi:hypothetical protein KSF_051660 [Reticulibacter mediterranei]|uniref:Uncharacterized protein n=1 Tax=Reticulibacter mediterranei TaxID=2778369 RepID=A0A8J3IJX4_9CHLR|nr:aminoglycoside 6-adenylyltransferase [Reticulibacter mediterranei]GHO95118.1 hypothetical protein KSF_051660 [Reticulibacter mediterranei]